MKIVQSTWSRFWHFDLAREMEKNGCLQHVFTTLPWWKADKESREQGVPRDKISCNFWVDAIRRVGWKMPLYTGAMDDRLAVFNTKNYSKWVAKNLPECDAFIGISGSGLHAGRLAKSRGAGYVMDRGSTQIRYSDTIMRDEFTRWDMPWKPIDPWLIENEEAEAEEANLITVPSHFVKQTFIRQGTAPEKIKVVPFGVSLSEFYPIHQAPDDRFRLVFVGQVSLRKGIPYLLKAFDEFDHPNKELVIVGSVPDEMKPLISKMTSDNVKFVGIVPRAKVKEYMSSAHALVLPSIEEGLALVQAQAMACGCPVIATPNTGAETLFKNGEHGLIVEVRNTRALTDAFTQLCDDRLLQKAMRAACLEKVNSIGGWETYGLEMLKVFEEAQTMQLNR